MKPYVFSRHACNRLRRVKLTQDELLELLLHASARRREAARENVWLRWQGEWIRVVLVEEPDTILVVTVIWPAREPRSQQI